MTEFLLSSTSNCNLSEKTGKYLTALAFYDILLYGKIFYFYTLFHIYYTMLCEICQGNYYEKHGKNGIKTVKVYKIIIFKNKFYTKWRT